VAEAGLCSGLRCAGLSRLTASAASEYADAAPLLIFVGTTKRRDVLGAAERLKATGAPLIGAVLVGKDDDGGYSVRSRPHALVRNARGTGGHVMTMTSESVRTSRKV
jgi:hypothetical protein